MQYSSCQLRPCLTGSGHAACPKLIGNGRVASEQEHARPCPGGHRWLITTLIRCTTHCFGSAGFRAHLCKQALRGPARSDLLRSYAALESPRFRLSVGSNLVGQHTPRRPLGPAGESLGLSSTGQRDGKHLALLSQRWLPCALVLAGAAVRGRARRDLLRKQQP